MIWALHGNVGLPADWKFLRPDFNLHAPCLWEQVEDFTPWSHHFCESVRARDSAPVLLGYSLGGRLALHALLAAPHLWRAAIVVSAHPGLASAEEKSARRQLDATWAQAFRELPWAEAIALWNRQPILQGSPTGADRATLEPLREAIARSFEVWSLGQQENLLPRLYTLSLPVLWITGAFDHKYQDLAEAAVGQVPQGTHQILPECGHRAPWQNSAEFARRIKDFLSRQNLLA